MKGGDCMMSNEDKLETTLLAILYDELEKLKVKMDDDISNASYYKYVENKAKLNEVEYLVDRFKKELNIA